MIEKIKTLAKLGLENGRENSDIIEVKPVSGGDINEAFYIKTKEAQFFMKYHPNAPKAFFQCEAMGLRKIKETNTVHVPNYLAYSDKAEEGFLLLEWVEGTKTEKSETILGQKLAQFHQKTGRRHGLKTDTYIGLLKQPNTVEADWLKYYREKRLGNQLLIGVEKGLIEGERRQKLEKLMEHLDKWIPSIIAPSPLHGDL